MNIINYLKTIGYDYLPLCHADGVQDDSRIMQMRLDAGFNPLKAKGDKGAFLIKNTINATSDVIFDGKAI